MKRSLGGADAVKDFVLNHGEKVGAALVGMFVLLLVYWTVGIDRLDANQPTNLTDLANRAINHVHQPRFGPKELDQPIFKTLDIIEQDSWKTSTALDPRIWPPNTKRDDPQLYPVEKIEVSADFGPIATTDLRAGGRPQPDMDATEKIVEQSKGADLESNFGRNRMGWGNLRRLGYQPTKNDELKGKAWVVVVGKIPLKKQIGEFDRVFQNAEFPTNNDSPHYKGYIVERRDVTEDAKAEWEKRQSVIARTLAKKTENYSGQVREIADERCVDYQVVTEPLPCLVGRELGDGVVHSDIPHAQTPEQLERERLEQERENWPTDDPKAEEGKDLFDDDQTGSGRIVRRPSRGPSRGISGFGMPPGLLGGMPPGFGLGRGGPGGPGGMGLGGPGGMGLGGPGGMGLGGPSRSPMLRGRGGGMRQDGAYAQVPYLLFRFFDFEVKPGRRYEYRVRLVMGDPNHSVYPRYLTKSAADRRSSWRKPYRFTDWSQPSPPIAVPFAGRMLAGRAKAPLPQLFDVEPKISVLVKTFDTPEAAEAMTELALADRGTVGNLTRSIDISKLVGDRLQPMENYRFHTESTILDIRGGRKLSRSSNEDLTAPAHILILTRSGKLIVQSELKNQPEYDEYRAMFENEDDEQIDRGHELLPVQRGKAKSIYRGGGRGF